MTIQSQFRVKIELNFNKTCILHLNQIKLESMKSKIFKVRFLKIVSEFGTNNLIWVEEKIFEPPIFENIEPQDYLLIGES